METEARAGPSSDSRPGRRARRRGQRSPLCWVPLRWWWGAVSRRGIPVRVPGCGWGGGSEAKTRQSRRVLATGGFICSPPFFLFLDLCCYTLQMPLHSYSSEDPEDEHNNDHKIERFHTTQDGNGRKTPKGPCCFKTRDSRTPGSKRALPGSNT